VAELISWTDGPAKSAIVDFVKRVATDGSPDYVEPQARIAVFDNDGTLWCEKPMYIQLDFLIRRFAEQAQADPSLRERQPYKAAAEGDLRWFGEAVTKHYQGDDSEVKPLVGAILTAHHEITVEEHAGRVSAFFNDATHPTLPRVHGVRVPANGRAAALPGGQRIYVLHRVRRWSGLHAPDHQCAVRDSARARGRQLGGAGLPRR
jgi:hypothetical protein